MSGASQTTLAHAQRDALGERPRRSTPPSPAAVTGLVAGMVVMFATGLLVSV